MKSIVLVLMLSAAIVAQPQLDTSFEPNEKHPFGRLNPKAPAETKQFSFLIGDFECRDRIFNPAVSKWFEFKALWSGKYFLNGHAIQDNYWSPAFSASNIRVFDAKNKNWLVTFYRMPGHSPSDPWKGKKEGDNLVMRKGDEKNGSRLTFHKISDKGFEWKGENLKDGKPSVFWTSSCKNK